MLLNIVFHALMGRFQLELFIFITYFSSVVPLTNCVFFPVGLSSLSRHFQQFVLLLILLNMFHAPMGRFQLELFIFITNFSTVVPLNICVFFPVGLSTRDIFNRSCRVLKFQRKGHRKENTTIEWDDGEKIGNKNK